MKYRVSAVVALIVSVLVIGSQAQTFVPPVSGDHYGVQSSGWIYVLKADMDNLKAKGCSVSSKPEIRTSLKTDANGKWLEGMTMQVWGNYYAWYCGQSLAVGSPVEFCIGVAGVNSKIFAPHLYMWAQYRSLADAFINWPEVVSNGGGGYNYVVAVK